MRSSWAMRFSILSVLIALGSSVGVVHGAPARRGRTVKVTELVQGVEVRRAPADWEECRLGMELSEGHEISCDPDGQVVLAFGDNSTVVVQPMTQMKIGSFFTKGGVIQTEILLKVGELAAKVNKSDTIRSDFKVRSPTATASVRGTEMRSIRYDPVIGMQIAMVSGTLDLVSREGGGSTRLTGQDTGRAEQGGRVQDPQSFRRQNQGTNAFAQGFSRDEARQIQGRFEPPIGDPRAGGGDPGMIGQMAGAGLLAPRVIIDARFDGFLDRLPPGAFSAAAGNALNASLAVPGDLGGFSTTNGSRALAIQSGNFNPGSIGQPGPLTGGLAGFAQAVFELPGPATLNISFDYNFVTLETITGSPRGSPGDLFGAVLEAGGTTTFLVKRDTGFESTATMSPVSVGPGSNGLVNGISPTTGYQTGTQTVNRQVTVNAAGPAALSFAVDGGFSQKSGVIIDNVKVTATPAGPLMVP